MDILKGKTNTLRGQLSINSYLFQLPWYWPGIPATPPSVHGVVIQCFVLPRARRKEIRIVIQSSFTMTATYCSRGAVLCRVESKQLCSERYKSPQAWQNPREFGAGRVTTSCFRFQAGQHTVYRYVRLRLEPPSASSGSNNSTSSKRVARWQSSFRGGRPK